MRHRNEALAVVVGAEAVAVAVDAAAIVVVAAATVVVAGKNSFPLPSFWVEAASL